jgi:hypothetical protein
MTQQRIVCAAIRHDNGDVIAGPRHFDLFMHDQIRNYKLTQIDWRTAEQGFLDQFGTFLSREAAWWVAVEADQIRKIVGGNDRNMLYSENLY